MKPLSSIVGRESFKRILGIKVYDVSGAYVGFLKRVYIDRRSGRAKRLVVKLLDGALMAVNPSEAVLGVEGLMVNRRIAVGTSDFVALIAKLEEKVRELREIREKILELDEAYIAGEMTRDTYICFRGEIEAKRKIVLSGIRGLLEEAEGMLLKLEEERDRLLEELRNGGTTSKEAALSKLRRLRSMIAKVNELADSIKDELAFEMDLDDFIEKCLRMS